MNCKTNSTKADSLEKTGENVPLGFLSFVLGYLCLEASIKDRVISQLPDRRMGHLIFFIEEFLVLFKAVDEIHEGTPGHKSNSEQYKTLEAMINTLKSPSR